MPIFRLSSALIFPSVYFAEPDGLLAVGGDLSRKRLLLAYRSGIFPWYSKGEPILWWSPDPRLLLYPDALKISRSTAKIIRKKKFEITMDQAFLQVIQSCARNRGENRNDTWILADIIDAYNDLHKSGLAHSVEAWYEGKLAGGLYGISLGRCFFGESMFTRVNNASKVALAALCNFVTRRSFAFIDCQVPSDHLLRLGAKEVPRSLFLRQLESALNAPTLKGPWAYDAKNCT